MKTLILSLLAFLMMSCSSNKENSEANDFPKPIEEPISEDDRNNADLKETASKKDSISEPHEDIETSNSNTDTTPKTKESMDPRVQRILDEKLTQEMKDSLRNTKSEKQ